MCSSEPTGVYVLGHDQSANNLKFARGTERYWAPEVSLYARGHSSIALCLLEEYLSPPVDRIVSASGITIVEYLAVPSFSEVVKQHVEVENRISWLKISYSIRGVPILNRSLQNKALSFGKWRIFLDQIIHIFIAPEQYQRSVQRKFKNT